MKQIRIYLLSGLTALAALSCAKLEHPEIATENENIQNLVLSGSVVGETGGPYAAVVDLEGGTAVVQVPYYLSDAEPIQADLTKMRLSATLPVGATFTPSLAGIHDLLEGIRRTLTYADGRAYELHITAAYTKSDKAQLFGFPRGVAITHAVNEPREAGGKGTFTILRTVDNERQLRAASLSYSAWATLESDALNADGTIDLTQGKDLTVVSQNGQVRTTYAIVFEVPSTVDYGVSNIQALFGIQPLESDPAGFTKGANRTLAVVGDYLILSNADDFSKMPVYNRYTGEYLGNDFVVTDGIAPNATIHAITTDDAGHLVAVTMVSNREGQETDNQIVYGYLWKEGIDNSPTQFMEANILGGGWTSLGGSANRELFRTVSVRGDLTSGKAIVATTSKFLLRHVFVSFTDGHVDGWPAMAEWKGGTGIVESLWNGTKPILLTNEIDQLAYYWSSGNFRSIVARVDRSGAFGFDLPTSHWWRGSGTYDHEIIAMDHIAFNGAHLVAVQNGLFESGRSRDGENQGYYRCYVADVTAAPTATSLTDGFLFDTREGNAAGTDGIPGTGYATTGMTSAFAFNGGTVLGANVDHTGDVVFARGADGYSVQLYMLTTDQGLIGYTLDCLK